MAKYAPLSPPIQGMPIAGLDQREVKTLPGYQDDWDLLQENLESSGMFPFAPGLGDAASELGDLILYSASGKGRDGIDRVNDLDRFVTLPATWAGQAAQEFGGLLQMTPEQLVQLRRSLGALFSGDPEAKAALWEGIKQAASGYGEDPMSLAEDVGSPGLAIAAPRLSQKILSGLAKKTPKMDFPEGPGLEKLSPKTPEPPLAPEVSAQQLQSYHTPQTAGWDVDNIDADQWDNFVHSNDPDAIKITHTELDVAEDLPPEGFPGGAGDSAFDYETQKWVEGVPALDMKIKQIKEELEILQGPKGAGYAQFTGSDLDTAKKMAQQKLDDLEFRKSQRKKGGGGSAGAQKAKGWEAQMMQESGKVQADLPDMPGGAIGKLAYNIENFHAGADIGNVPQILETARFIPKRNMWHFPVDPDVGVFDLNGFFNRMAHPKHELNSDEITVLARVLEQAKAYPSRRNLSSMAEDLYKTMVSGPAKSGLEGIGFNIQ